MDLHSHEIIWKKLIDWVNKHRGKVNSCLTLTTDFDGRGVTASQDIKRGELLIRLSPECVLSGKDLSMETGSPWARCIAAYYQASIKNHWKPYLNSLPQRYETLFQWTDTEIDNYLRGTTLGKMFQIDRKEKSMQTRYEKSVRPFLKDLSLLKGERNEDDEWKFFLQACMCISTRGFHYYDATSGSNLSSSFESTSYQGPFLLPVIDLLNHDPPNKCTTLQYSDGYFIMIAERPISKGEAIVHSYGNSLTAAQLLQTFGFALPQKTTNFTPACLSKTQHLLKACAEVKASSIPTYLKAFLETEEDEAWNISDIPPRESDLLAADSLIDCSSPLSDEIITYFVLQFLPQEAYEEIASPSTLLDESILQDVFLGVLVCRSILLAVDLKIKEYTLPGDSKKTDDRESTTTVQTRLAVLLEQKSKALVQYQKDKKHRAVYGLSVQIEEMKSLKSMGDKAQEILENLFEGSPPPKLFLLKNTVTTTDANLSPTKRPKLPQGVNRRSDQ